MTRAGLLQITWSLVIAVGGIVAQPATYDQRQQGKLNVQVDVKDLQIVALVDTSDILGDYNYDYTLYDEADFTIKPSTKRTTTTIQPSSTTTMKEPSSSTSDNDVSSSSESSASSTLVDSTTAKASEEKVNDTTLTAVTNAAPTAEVIIVESTTEYERVSSTTGPGESTTSVASTSNDATSTTTKRPLGSAEPRKRCPMGFQMRSGRCFKRRLSLLSARQALMKLAPTLLQGKSRLFGSGHSTTLDVTSSS